jgi:hypothetical protein
MKDEDLEALIQTIIQAVHETEILFTEVGFIIFLENFIRETVNQYAEQLDYTPFCILSAFEEFRKGTGKRCIDFYKKTRFPNLGTVIVFESAKDFNECFSSQKYRCPACDGISTDPYICNAGTIRADGTPCTWEADGYFGTLGKGFRFLIRTGFLVRPIVYNIFAPIELEGETNG